MKIFKIFVFSMALTIVCSFQYQADAYSVEFVPSNPIIYAGNNFNVDVFVKDAYIDSDEAIAFGFDVKIYNPGIVSYNSAIVSPAFFDDSGLFPNTNVNGSAFPGITDNNFLLATLKFNALNPGTVNLGIFSDLLDQNEGLIYFMSGTIDLTSSFNLTINQNPNPVPIPSSILLLGSGSSILIVIRKFIKIKIK